MNTPKERILLVESDPEIADLISRQTLVPMGFRVEVVGSASSAIPEALRFSPDIIIVNLSLPGLSGKDMLVALTSQGLDVPILVLASEGMEGDIIQSFRLGAADFLMWPFRETELVSAVERLLKQVRARRERELLSRQLNQTNQELQRRVRELTTIFAIGKAVISVTDLRSLFDKIVEGAAYIVDGDVAWLLIRDDRSKAYILSAHRNLPKSISAYINKPWDDGLSSLVALSGEALSIHGDPLKRFKVAQLGQSALVVPVKVKNEVIGLLVVVRKAAHPFGASNQALLEAVADYASIALVNARLFRTIEDRAHVLQQVADSATVSEKIIDELLLKAGKELDESLSIIRGNIDMLLGNTMGKLNVEQNNALMVVKDRLKAVDDISKSMSASKSAENLRTKDALDMNDLIRKGVAKFQPLVQQFGMTIFAELPPNTLQVNANHVHVAAALDALLSNAIRYNSPSGQITLRLEKSAESEIRVTVQDHGGGLDERQLGRLFDGIVNKSSTANRRFGGLGIGLKLTKEIIASYGGKIWAESKPEQGTSLYFTLPLAKD